MKVITEYISVDSKGHTDIINITQQTEEKLSKSGLKAGTVTLFVAGATAGLSTIEYEPGLLKDVPAMFDKLAPEGTYYHHDATWHDGNGNSHVRATLQGPSLVVPFSNKKLTLGTWQQIILLDFDNRSRSRQIIIQIMGE